MSGIKVLQRLFQRLWIDSQPPGIRRMKKEHESHVAVGCYGMTLVPLTQNAPPVPYSMSHDTDVFEDLLG